jgi:hypothetical protein
MMLVSLAKMTEVVNLKNTSRKKRQNRNENKMRGVSFELQISKRQLSIYIQVRKRGKKKKKKKIEGNKENGGKEPKHYNIYIYITKSNTS